jgi:manganese/iron transport system permease protein
LALLTVVASAVILLVVFFFKEIQAVIFQREVALAVGLPANLIFYAMLVLTGSAITVSLSSIGGLLIFNFTWTMCH